MTLTGSNAVDPTTAPAPPAPEDKELKPAVEGAEEEAQAAPGLEDRVSTLEKTLEQHGIRPREE